MGNSILKQVASSTKLVDILQMQQTYLQFTCQVWSDIADHELDSQQELLHICLLQCANPEHEGSCAQLTCHDLRAPAPLPQIPNMIAAQQKIQEKQLHPSIHEMTAAAIESATQTIIRGSDRTTGLLQKFIRESTVPSCVWLYSFEEVLDMMFAAEYELWELVVISTAAQPLKDSGIVFLIHVVYVLRCLAMFHVSIARRRGHALLEDLPYLSTEREWNIMFVNVKQNIAGVSLPEDVCTTFEAYETAHIREAYLRLWSFAYTEHDMSIYKKCCMVYSIMACSPKRIRKVLEREECTDENSVLDDGVESLLAYSDEPKRYDHIWVDGHRPSKDQETKCVVFCKTPLQLF